MTKKKPARKSAPKKKTTALARRKPELPARIVEVLPPAVKTVRSIGDDILLGELGLVEIKLKPEEETILAEPVAEKDIQVKPTGQIYIPHPAYTRWFNRAFGRLGWALVPVSKPQKAVSGRKVTVVVAYVLYIHGQPAAFAQGGQDYYEDNAEQTFDDALESTVAYALRRCAKRLGVGLEMWDRSFGERFIRANGLHVKVLVGKAPNQTEKWMWRLRGSEPFWNEVQGKRAQQQQTQRDEPPPPNEAHNVGTMTGRTPGAAATIPGEQRTTHGAEGEVITQPQRQRLALIINNSDRTDVEVVEWLRKAYGLQGEKPTKSIVRRDYDGICRAIEAKGPLPQGRAQ